MEKIRIIGEANVYDVDGIDFYLCSCPFCESLFLVKKDSKRSSCVCPDCKQAYSIELKGGNI